GPVGLGHPPPVRAEPPDVGGAGALPLLAGQELRAAEHRMLRAEAEKTAGEVEDAAGALVEVPVEPGELVVLAVGVVVPGLRAPELVAGEQHRCPLGEEQRRQEVPGLPVAEL